MQKIFSGVRFKSQPPLFFQREQRIIFVVTLLGRFQEERLCFGCNLKRGSLYVFEYLLVTGQPKLPTNVFWYRYPYLALEGLERDALRVEGIPCGNEIRDRNLRWYGDLEILQDESPNLFGEEAFQKKVLGSFTVSFA